MNRRCWPPPGIAGVDEVYRVGGAQAVAALAYGAATIAPVDKIVGPGNAYVAAAKRQVFGVVGIDMLAGPSEIVVVAQPVNDPDWVAADLLSQAEHDERAQAILITDERRFADQVSRRLGGAARATESGRRSPPPAGASTAPSSWSAGSKKPPRWSTRMAPEHLELIGADAEALAPSIRHAGVDIPRAADARGDRRLCRRPEPRAADRPHGAVLLGARRLRLPQAHHAFGMRRAGFARLGSRRGALARAEGLEAHAAGGRAAARSDAG